MHVDKARKVGAGIAAGAAIVTIVNIINYGENVNGIVTFLYIATALAFIGSLLMIAIYSVNEHQRNSMMHHKMIAIIGLVIINVVFAIPSIQWISKYIDVMNLPYYEGSSAAFWLTRLILGLILQTFATVWFVYYSKLHGEGGAHVGGYIPAPMGVHH
jgi:membrane-associated HD superfamily phosphohydrolase